MEISQGNPGTTTVPSDKTSAQSLPAVESPTILLVDDDPAILNICSQCLIEEGFTVLRAGGSQEALQICRKYPGPIDLLITDLVLAPARLQLRTSKVQQPSMNGLQLMQQILGLRQHAKVILMSGHTDEALESLYIIKEGRPFLRKPFSVTTLVRMAHEALDVQEAQLAQQAAASRG